MFKKLSLTEYYLIFSITFLLIISVIAITSVSSDSALQKLDSPYYYIIRHIVYIIIGISLALIVSRINLDFIKKYSLFLLLANISLMALVLKFGFSAGGATRWIAVGPFTAQPSEFLKLTFLIYFCFLLSKIPKRKNNKLKNKSNNYWKSYLICFLFFLISILFLVMQRDASTLIVLFLILLITYFVSGISIKQGVLIFMAGLAGIISLIKFTPYRLERLHVFLDPSLDPMGVGYQIKQIAIAIGSGGLFGLGWGMSRQKLGFLPESMTDSIFAIICEESGFIGGSLLVFLFLVFLWSGLNIAKNASDKFSALLATGITSWIVLQGLINIGAMLRLFPLTGIPLPFISYGGSHMITELVAIGLLLNIARKSKIK